jgi:hypothetical protein
MSNDDDTPDFSTQHYDTSRLPAQHPDGLRVAPPISHTEPEIPQTLYGLFDQIEHMRQTARHFHTDPAYHRLIAALRQHRVVLLALHAEHPESVMIPRVIEQVEVYTERRHR